MTHCLCNISPYIFFNGIKGFKRSRLKTLLLQFGSKCKIMQNNLFKYLSNSFNRNFSTWCYVNRVINAVKQNEKSETHNTKTSSYIFIYRIDTNKSKYQIS